MYRNLTTHYLARCTAAGTWHSDSDVLLTVEHYGPRTRSTRLGIAAMVQNGQNWHPLT